MGFFIPFGKTKTTLELSFLFLASTPFALRLCCCGWVTHSLVYLCFWFRSGRRVFFQFLLDVLSFYPPRFTPNPFSHPHLSLRLHLLMGSFASQQETWPARRCSPLEVSKGKKCAKLLWTFVLWCLCDVHLSVLFGWQGASTSPRINTSIFISVYIYIYYSVHIARVGIS